MKKIRFLTALGLCILGSNGFAQTTLMVINDTKTQGIPSSAIVRVNSLYYAINADSRLTIDVPDRNLVDFHVKTIRYGNQEFDLTQIDHGCRNSVISVRIGGQGVVWIQSDTPYLNLDSKIYCKINK